MQETLGQRITRLWKLRKDEYPTMVALARAAGMKPTTLSEVIHGRSKSTTRMAGLANALGVSSEHLETGGSQQVLRGSEWRDVMGYRVAASLGNGERADEYAETHKLKFRAYSLQRQGLHPSKLGICYGRGDSMLPRIHDGDAILFDTSDVHPLKDGRLYVIDLGDTEGLVAKRVTEIGGAWYMEALNTSADGWAKPRRLNLAGNGGRVIGRVRWIGSWEP